MAKQDNKTWIVILILGIILVYGGNQGWFQSTTYSIGGDVTNILENPSNPEGVRCNLKLDKYSITKGDQITGTISNGKNTFCEVYGKYEGTWQKIFEGTTNINGELTSSEYINLPGEFTLIAICGEGSDQCTTNSVTLTVNDVPSSTCTDSDGKNKMTPGWVIADGIYYYDDCAGNWAVKEYWCNGNVLTESVIGCEPGYICTETRSGDYCGTTDSGYDVGDVLDSGSNSGTHPAGSGYSIWGIYPENVEIGGDCYLGIKINTQLDYVAGTQCETDVNIYFHGSDQPWSSLGSFNIPSSDYFDLCPVFWDGSVWAIKFEPTNSNCPFEYSYDYKIYICECN